MILELLFWLSIAALFHSYILYPFVLKILAQGKEENKITFEQGNDLPMISVLLSVYNEEMVIPDKIRSIYYTLYPLNKLEVLVGSDCSTDGTGNICRVFTENYENFRFFEYTARQGKPSVINRLFDEARGEILILTDAKVFFEINTLFELIRHFKNPEIDIVGGNIINEKTDRKGISIQEKAFMNREIRMKYREGLIWGKTMGIYGANYAIRKNAFQKIPEGFSVDDFYVTMSVLKTNRKAILNLSALSTENVPDDLSTEFRRKVRISAGNFQNLKYFFSCLWPPFNSLAFAFFSHKVIRWTGPFLLILILVANILLAPGSAFYSASLVIQVVLCLSPIADYFLRKLNLHIIFLRFITHFYAMNIALLIGFIKYISGMKTNIWQPTRR